MIQHRGRFAVPFRQRVGDPANVVKHAINVQRTLLSENIADDDRFVGIHNRRSPHCDNRAADNLTYPHFDSFLSAAAGRNIYSAHNAPSPNGTKGSPIDTFPFAFEDAQFSGQLLAFIVTSARNNDARTSFRPNVDRLFAKENESTIHR